MLGWSSLVHDTVRTQETNPALSHTENEVPKKRFCDMRSKTYLSPATGKAEEWGTTECLYLLGIWESQWFRRSLLPGLSNTCFLVHKHWLICFLFDTQEIHSNFLKFFRHFARKHEHLAWSPSLPSPAEACILGREREHRCQFLFSKTGTPVVHEIQALYRVYLVCICSLWPSVIHSSQPQKARK